MAAACDDCPEPNAAPCPDCPEAPPPGEWVKRGARSVRVDDAVYAWTEPVFHVWSAVLPLLLVPPAWHVLFHDHEANAEHSHTWLWVFAAVWLVCWVAAVPYACVVAYRGRPVERVTCATRGEALRLAGAVRKKLGVPG